MRNYAGAESQPTRDQTSASDYSSAGCPAENAANQAGADASGQSDADEDDDLTERTTKIRSEIEQTREEMTETIDAIQEKLRPSNIVANATDRVKQATTERVRSMADMASGTANEMMDYGREAYGSVAGEVRQNPIPIAMIGIGAAWLLFGHNKANRGWRDDTGWRDRPTHRGGDAGTYADRSPQSEGIWRRAHREQSGGSVGEYEARGSGRYSGQFDDGGGIVNALTSHPVPTALAAMGIAWLAFSDRGGSSQRGGWTGSGWSSNDQWRRQYRDAQRQGIGYTGTNTGSGGSDYEGSTSATGAYESVKESAQGVAASAQHYASQAQEYAGQAQDYAGEAMETVQRRGRQAQNELQRMMHDNPLLVGAGALAVGAVIGLALPETERENEWMGDARDTVIERAETMARDAAAKVQDAAGDVVGEVASRVVSGK